MEAQLHARQIRIIFALEVSTSISLVTSTITGPFSLTTGDGLGGSGGTSILVYGVVPSVRRRFCMIDLPPCCNPLF
jgi:hypothetical protein